MITTSYAEDHWLKRYQAAGALWVHDGNPARPHALLTSGNHSGGFCNSERIQEDPHLQSAAAIALVRALNITDAQVIMQIDRVVGPAMGAITLAHDVARHITEFRGRTCLRAYVEKAPEDRMVFTRTAIIPGERILLVEDVLTTGQSVERARRAVQDEGGDVLPYVCVLLNRSGLAQVSGLQIVALITKHIENWQRRDCPLCKQGSEAIRPKEKENWMRLTADYS